MLQMRMLKEEDINKMIKRNISWKEHKVISIQTRKGIFVIAQMLKDPFIRFYKLFRTDENWDKIDLYNCETLFTVAVTRQFLKSSHITYQKNAIADKEREDSKIWIHQKYGTRKVKVWEGTENEEECLILGNEPGGALVEKYIWWSPTPGNAVRKHPSGVFDALLMENIPLNADEIIDKYELTNLGIYPGLNERLYLCYFLNRIVDPYKDLVFRREIPLDYKVAIDIIALGGNSDVQERILNNYFI